MKEKVIEEFIEKGADLEHERWAKWQEYFFSKCQIKPQSQLDGMDDRYVYFALSKDLYERWNRQIITKYPELSEREKESDRIEVRKYLPLISSTYDTAYERGKADGHEKGVRDAMEIIGEDYKIVDNWANTHDRDMPRFSTLDKYEKRVNQERSRLRLALSELLKK